MKQVVSYNIQAKTISSDLLNCNYFINEADGCFETYSEENSLGVYSSLPAARRAIVAHVYQNGAIGISFTQL